MTPEAQRIAIAEACGKKYHKPTPEEIASGSYYQYEPDYLSDLNAMHEAENILLHDMNRLWFPYCKKLHEITNGIGEGATAAQRAEAFLRTLGKWKE